jgi:hypothetical protein
MVRGPWKKLVENWQIKTELCRAYQSATAYRAEPNSGSEFQLVTNTEQMQEREVRWRRIAGLPRKGRSLQLRQDLANNTSLPLSAVPSKMQGRGLKVLVSWIRQTGSASCCKDFMQRQVAEAFPKVLEFLNEPNPQVAQFLDPLP